MPQRIRIIVETESNSRAPVFGIGVETNEFVSLLICRAALDSVTTYCTTLYDACATMMACGHELFPVTFQSVVAPVDVGQLMVLCMMAGCTSQEVTHHVALLAAFLAHHICQILIVVTADILVSGIISERVDVPAEVSSMSSTSLAIDAILLACSPLCHRLLYTFTTIKACDTASVISGIFLISGRLGNYKLSRCACECRSIARSSVIICNLWYSDIHHAASSAVSNSQILYY